MEQPGQEVLTAYWKERRFG